MDLRELERGESYDWDAVAAKFPRVRGIVRVSEPAFDSLSKHAIVRIDVLTPQRATTHVISLVKETDGTWKTGKMALGTYDTMHRSDASINPPAR
jgi:hypothetical protein